MFLARPSQAQGVGSLEGKAQDLLPDAQGPKQVQLEESNFELDQKKNCCQAQGESSTGECSGGFHSWAG